MPKYQPQGVSHRKSNAQHVIFCVYLDIFILSFLGTWERVVPVQVSEICSRVGCNGPHLGVHQVLDFWVASTDSWGKITRSKLMIVDEKGELEQKFWIWISQNTRHSVGGIVRSKDSTNLCMLLRMREPFTDKVVFVSMQQILL